MLLYSACLPPQWKKFLRSALHLSPGSCFLWLLQDFPPPVSPRLSCTVPSTLCWLLPISVKTCLSITHLKLQSKLKTSSDFQVYLISLHPCSVKVLKKNDCYPLNPLPQCLSFPQSHCKHGRNLLPFFSQIWHPPGLLHLSKQCHHLPRFLDHKSLRPP